MWEGERKGEGEGGELVWSGERGNRCKYFHFSNNELFFSRFEIVITFYYILKKFSFSFQEITVSLYLVTSCLTLLSYSFFPFLKQNLRNEKDGKKTKKEKVRKRTTWMNETLPNSQRSWGLDRPTNLEFQPKPFWKSINTCEDIKKWVSQLVSRWLRASILVLHSIYSNKLHHPRKRLDERNVSESNLHVYQYWRVWWFFFTFWGFSRIFIRENDCQRENPTFP